MDDNKIISDILESLIGDVPVSEQLGTALTHMAKKEHTHDEYALRKEVDLLKLEIEKLTSLVGDVAVSEQINAAINEIK